MHIAGVQDSQAARHEARGSEQEARAAWRIALDGPPRAQDVRHRGQGQQPVLHEPEPTRPGPLRQARDRKQQTQDVVALAPGPERKSLEPERKSLDPERKILDPERRLLTGEGDRKGGVPCRKETSNEKQ